MFGKRKKSNSELIAIQITIVEECLHDIEKFLISSLGYLGIDIGNYLENYRPNPDINQSLVNSLFLKDENAQDGFLCLGGTTNLKGVNFFAHTSLYFILNALVEIHEAANSDRLANHIDILIKKIADTLFNTIFMRIWLSNAQAANSAIANKDIESIKKIRIQLQNQMLDALNKLPPQILPLANFKQIGEKFWTLIPYVTIELGTKRFAQFYNLPMNETARQDIINYLEGVAYNNHQS